MPADHPMRRAEDQHMLLLGEIKAKVDMNLDETKGLREDVGAIKTRLTTLETRAGTVGGMAGAVISIGVALFSEKLKRTIGA
jgi:hypothetical protein